MLMMMSLFMLSVIAFAAFLPVNIHQKEDGNSSHAESIARTTGVVKR
jgi:hypothetical protein